MAGNHQGRMPPAARAQHGALFDGLTGLPGWALLVDRTHVALARAARYGPMVAVLVFDDVTRLPGVSPGFAAFGQVLRDGVRPDDTVARLDGRTFVVVCNDIREHADVTRIAQRLLQGARVSCRLGVALAFPGEDPVGLITRALDEAASLDPRPR